jgi:23S rRNA (uridine2552-2'-O)-methyltransferase
MSWRKNWKDEKFVKKSQTEGKICRAYYKLGEINDRFRLIGKDVIKVLELGGSPGGWSQYIKEVNSHIHLTSLDLIPNKIEVDKFLLQSIFDPIDGNDYELLLSDIAPNLTGESIVDQSNMERIINRIIEIFSLLKRKSNVAIKTFGTMQQLHKYFKKYKYFKPLSSHKSSNEIYFIGICLIKK